MFLKTLRSNPSGWLIVGVVFLTVSFSFGARMSLPVLIPGWEIEFLWSRTFLTFGAALIMIIMGSAAPFAGHLLDKYGPRYLISGGTILSGICVSFTSMMGANFTLISPAWLFIGIYCALSALGYGLVSLPIASATIAQNFEENRGLAISIGSSGVGGGQLFFIPLMGWMITAVGWRPTLAAFGFLIAFVGFVSFFFLKDTGPPEQDGEKKSNLTDSMFEKIKKLFKQPIIWLLGGAYFICGFTTAGVVKVHFIPYATSCGYTLATGAAATGVLAGFDMVGMVFSGYLTDRLHRPALLGTVYFLRALTFIMLFFITDNLAILFLFAVIFGTLDFATVPPTAGLVASHLGINSIGFNMGILFLGHSIGGAIGSIFGGWLFDNLMVYDWVWIIALSLALLAAVLAWSVPEKSEKNPTATQPLLA